jgi:NTP pyrophosphatase (non-canonical NTP hydrolase)
MKTTLDLLNELQNMADALSAPMDEDIARFQAAAGIAKEAGELLGIEDKRTFQGHGDSWAKSQIQPEVGDMLFYLFRYLRKSDIDLRDCLVAVIAKLKCRYPDGKFRHHHSIYRDKDQELAAIKTALSRDRVERNA